MKEIYEKLREHFNEQPFLRVRKAKELMEILEILFTPAQAQLALIIPPAATGGITLEELARKTNQNLEELEEQVETMAKEGLLMVNTGAEDGKKRYGLFMLLPGMLESAFADGIYSDKRHRLSKLIDKYRENGLWNELASSDYPLFRVVPVNSHIDPMSEVLPYEEITNIIAQADTITIIPCLCRTTVNKCTHIREADFVFGAWAEYLINYRGAKRWTKEDALKRLRECEEHGLMHLVGNSQEGWEIICSCCTCCCMALRGLTEMHNPRSFVKSNFLPRIDPQKCTLCLTCQKVCEMRAISRLPGYASDGSDTKMLIQESRCVGCGLCASHCPKEAITLFKVRQDVPAKNATELVARFMKEKVW